MSFYFLLYLVTGQISCATGDGVPLRALNREDPRSTMNLILRHKVDKAQVPVVTPAPIKTRSQ